MGWAGLAIGVSGPPSDRPANFVAGRASPRTGVPAQGRARRGAGRAVLGPGQIGRASGGLMCCGLHGHLYPGGTPSQYRSEFGERLQPRAAKACATPLQTRGQYKIEKHMKLLNKTAK